MLSAMLGAPARTRDAGSGTEYSGSMRSELLTETTVRASTRVLVAAARGATTAEASAGAAAGTAGAGADSARAVAGDETTVDALATLGPVGTGVDFDVAACCTTSCSGRAAAPVAGADLSAAESAVVEAGLADVAAGVTGTGLGDAESAVGVEGLVATTLPAGADACATGTIAGFVAAGAVDVTTVVDLTVVVQALDAVGEVDGAAALAGAVAELPCPDATVEPIGATGVTGGGGTCFAGVIAVPGRVRRVVSGRVVAVLAALRTLSAGMAGEPDRTVARRTCSIIAVRQQGRDKVRRTRPAVPSDSRRSDDPASASYRYAALHNFRDRTNRTPDHFQFLTIQLPCRTHGTSAGAGGGTFRP
jgi:hypothetical protein